jgi:hypothetical protein
MKYIVKSIDTYQDCVKAAWELAKEKGTDSEKYLHLTLTGNLLQVTSMGGGCILHTTVEVDGQVDGQAWVDGAHLMKVTGLLPAGRDLTVTLGDALSYQVQGYSSQHIPLAATYPTIPDLGKSVQLFTGVDLSSLQCKDKKAMVALTMKDYAVVLNMRLSTAPMRVLIPTAYTCPHPFSTEVSGYILSLMRKLGDATIYYYPSGYMAVVDTDMELVVPIITPPGDLGVADNLLALPTVYKMEVQQQDLLSAINWVALSGTNAITISYTDPYPYIEVREGDESPTKVPFSQGEDTDEVPLLMGEASYPPTTLLAALTALPKGTISLSGKQMGEMEGESPMTVLMLSAGTGSTIDVLLSPLA